MKVSELIEALQGLDPDYRVGVEVATPQSCTPELFEISGVEIELAGPRIRVLLTY